jgi:C-terminal processing protease CtpA/Prc
MFRRFASAFALLCLCGTLGSSLACAADRGTIGAQLGQKSDGRLFIREVPAGLAAAQAGLQPGDEITLINGRDPRALDEKGVHALLAGEIGDPVKLTVVRGNQVLHVTLKRTAPPHRLVAK